MTKEISFDPTFLCLLRNKLNLEASVLILIHILCAVGLLEETTVSTCMTAWEKGPYRYLIQWQVGRNIKIPLHLTYSSNAESRFLKD